VVVVNGYVTYGGSRELCGGVWMLRMSVQPQTNVQQMRIRNRIKRMYNHGKLQVNVHVVTVKYKISRGDMSAKG